MDVDEDDIIFLEEISHNIHDSPMKDCSETIYKQKPKTEEQLKLDAEAKKTEGNTYYKNKKYTQACDMYSKAIDLCPNCAAYYGNRCAALMMLNKYHEALEDARQATRLDCSFIKGHLREGKCHLVLGNPSAALHSYHIVLQHDSANTEAKNESDKVGRLLRFEQESEKDFQKQDFRKALFSMDRCIDISPSCTQYKIRRAEALALLKRYQEAQEQANDVLQREGMNADAVYVRGLCLYYQESLDKAFQHFQQVLRLAPDHTKARDIYRKAKLIISKKEEGNKKFKSQQWQDAFDIYTEALDIDPLNTFTNSKLYFNRATVSTKIQKVDQAVTDCTKAIELDSTYLKAYMRRAKCFMELERFEEAVRDYESIFKMDRTPDNQSLLKEAKLELKKSKRKDYYKLLGVQKYATSEEIKKGYRKRAMIHHPDRHSHDTVEKQKEEEIKFKECGEAYAVLSDANKKSRYDNGVDIEDLDGHGMSDIDPNLIFQAFFGGGNPFHGFGPTHSHFEHEQGGGFPGGYQFQFG